MFKVPNDNPLLFLKKIWIYKEMGNIKCAFDCASLIKDDPMPFYAAEVLGLGYKRLKQHKDSSKWFIKAADLVKKTGEPLSRQERQSNEDKLRKLASDEYVEQICEGGCFPELKKEVAKKKEKKKAKRRSDVSAEWLIFHPYFWTPYERCRFMQSLKHLMKRCRFMQSLKHLMKRRLIDKGTLNSKMTRQYDYTHWGDRIQHGILKAICNKGLATEDTGVAKYRTPTDIVRFFNACFVHFYEDEYNEYAEQRNQDGVMCSLIDIEQQLQGYFPNIYNDIFDSLFCYARSRRQGKNGEYSEDPSGAFQLLLRTSTDILGNLAGNSDFIVLP